MPLVPIAWLPDPSGLSWWRREVYRLEVADMVPALSLGRAVKISNDLSTYSSLSVSGDGKSFVTAQARPAATIYVGDSPPLLNDKIDWKLTPFRRNKRPATISSWTARQTAAEGCGFHIYSTSADGRSVRLHEDRRCDFGANGCGPGESFL